MKVRLHGWGSGESEVELSIPDSSDLGLLLADASPEAQGLLFARLRRHLVSEVVDAFAELEGPLHPAASSR